VHTVKTGVSGAVFIVFFYKIKLKKHCTDNVLLIFHDLIKVKLLCLNFRDVRTALHKTCVSRCGPLYN